MFLFDFILVMFLLASDLCTGCRHTFSSQLPSSKINTTIDVDASSLKLSVRAADLHHHTTASAAPFFTVMEHFDRCCCCSVFLQQLQLSLSLAQSQSVNHAVWIIFAPRNFERRILCALHNSMTDAS